MTGRSPNPPRSRQKPNPDGPAWVYGRHAVEAVLSNPDRHQHKLLATKNALDWLAERGRPIPIEPITPKALDEALPQGAVHQGLAVLVNPLKSPALEDVLEAGSGPVIVLDQVTDPQNIGAIFRLAAAFGARAIVAQDRRTPPLAGALAKAAVGAVERVPYVPVVNIARALETLKGHGFTVAGLAGDAEVSLPDFTPDRDVAIVLGAEGKGLRQLVRETCDVGLSIPMEPDIESLNVASAASIVLYALTRCKSG